MRNEVSSKEILNKLIDWLRSDSYTIGEMAIKARTQGFINEGQLHAFRFTCDAILENYQPINSEVPPIYSWATWKKAIEAYPGPVKPEGTKEETV